MKRIRLFWLLLMLLVSAALMPVTAQTTVTINNGTSKNSKVPVYAYLLNSRVNETQFIVPKATLETAGITDNIAQIVFYNSNASATLNGATFDVYLAETDKSSFSSTTISYPDDTVRVCTAAALTITDQQMVVKFSKPFLYSGEKNLLIGMKRNGAASADGSSSYSWYGVSSDSYCAVSAGASNERFMFLPKMTITYTPADIARPKYLTASSISKTGATLTWTDNKNGEGTTYELYWSTSAAKPDENTTPAETGLTDKSYNFTGKAGITYYVYVRAVKGGEKSRWSTVCEFTTAQTTVTIINGTSTNSSVPVCAYNLNSKVNESQFIIPKATLETAGITDNITQIVFYNSNASATLNGATFDVYLAETDNSSFSSTTISYPDDTVRVCTAAALTITDQQMVVKFSKPFLYSGEKNLLIGMKRDGAASAAGSSSYSWYGVNSSVPSNCAVYAGNNSARGTFLPKMTITYILANIARPKYLTASSISKTGATLTWTDNENGEGTTYELYWSTSAAKPDENTTPAEIGLTTKSYDFTGTAETTYYAYVRAKVGDEYSEWSTACVFTPTAAKEATIYNGTAELNNVPFNTYNLNSKVNESQFIIPKATLETAGITDNITQIVFYNSNASATLNGATFDVYLAETDNSSFGSTAISYPDDTVRVCTAAALTITDQQMVVKFSKPFPYSGEKNLLIGVKRNGAASAAGSTYKWYGVNSGVPSNCAVYAGTNGGTGTYLPKMTITYFPAGATRPENLTASNITKTGATLTWQDSNDEGTTYELYWSTSATEPDENTTPNVTGLTVKSYNFTGIAKTTYYAYVRAKVDNVYSKWSEVCEFTPSVQKLTVNGGNSASNNRIPYDFWNANDYSGYKSQFIIPASDLEDMVGGSIKKVRFHSTRSADFTSTNTIDVYMSEVTNTAFTSPYSITLDESDRVYAAGEMKVTSGYMEIVLNDDYEYNGGNLMIGFKTNGKVGYGNNGDKWYGVSTSEKTSLYQLGTSDVTAEQFIPEVTFNYLPAEGLFKPKNFTASSITKTGATLTWEDNKNGEGTTYELYWSTSATEPDENTTPTETGLTDKSYNFTGTAETTYYAYVRAKVGDEYSKWSTACVFTPTAAKVATINNGTETNNYVPVNTYYLNSYVNESQFIIPKATLETAEITDNITQIVFYNSSASASLNGATFDVYLAETDNSSYGSTTISYPSDTVRVCTAAALTITDKQMVVKFSKPFPYSGEKNLLIGMKRNGVASGSGGTYSWYGVSSGVPSNCAVYAGRNGGTGTFLPKMTITYIPADGLSKPKNLTASNITKTGATLTWEDNKNGEGTTYELYWSTSATEPDENATPAVTGLTEKSYKFIGTTETTYYAYVRAKLGDEYSEWSTVCVFTPSKSRTITVNDGTSTSLRIPISTYYLNSNVSKGQFIVPKATLETAGITMGSISQLVFYSSTTDGPLNGATFDVYLAETDNTSYSNSTFTYPEDTIRVCTAATLNIVDNKMVVRFSKPFSYSGEKNLLIGMERNGLATGETTGQYSWYGVTSSNSGVYVFSSLNERVSFLPKMDITYVPTTVSNPESVAASDITTTGATISWSEVSGADGYELCYGAAEDPEDEGNTIVSNLTATSYNLTGLNHETTYHVYVRATKDDDISNWSNCTFSTLPIVVTKDGFTLKLNATSDAFIVTDYDDTSTTPAVPSSVTYEGADYPVSTIGAEALKNHTTLTAITIPASITSIGTDAFKGCTGVTVVNFLGTTPPAWSDGTNGQEFGTSANTYLSVPDAAVNNYKTAYTAWAYEIYSDSHAPYVTHMAVSDITLSTARLTWQAMTGHDAWQVVYTVDGTINDPNMLTPINVTTTPSCQLVGLDMNTTYKVWIRDNVGMGSEWVAAGTFKTSSESVTISYTLGSDAVTVGGQYSGQTTWAGLLIQDSNGNYLKDENGYTIGLRKDKENEDVTGTISLNAGETYSFVWNETGNFHCSYWATYELRDAESEVILSGKSYESISPNGAPGYVLSTNPYTVSEYGWNKGDVIFTYTVQLPLRVDNLTVDPVSMRSATATWTARTGQTAWQVAWTADATAKPSTLESHAANTTTYQMTGLTPGTTYYLYVRAEDGDNQAWGRAKTFTTIESPVTNFAVSNIDETSATLNWTAGEGQTQWKVAYATHPVQDPSTLTSTTVTANAATYNLAGLNAGTIYYVYICATNGSCANEWSGATRFTTAGVKEISNTVIEGPIYINGSETPTNGGYYRLLEGQEVAFYYETAIEGDIRIPESFTVGGTTYRVTLLGKVPAKVTGLDMSNNPYLTTIRDNNALYECAPYLKNVNFSGCTNLTLDNFSAAVSTHDKNINNFTQEERYGLFSRYVNNQTFFYNPEEPADEYTNSPNRPYISVLESVDFSGCTSLTHIPGGFFRNVVTLKEANFSGCTNLNTVGNHLFYNCQNLEVMDFSNCTSLTENSFPYEYNEDYSYYSGETFPSLVTNPYVYETVNGNVAVIEKSIRKVDFSGCTGFTTLPIGLLSCRIDSVLFDGCTGLTTLQKQTEFGLDSSPSTLSWGLNAFGNRYSEPGHVSFKGCTNLTTIGESYFEMDMNGERLKSIDLSGCSSLTTIGDYAFRYRTHLETVNLEGCTALQRIGDGAFYQNLSLREIDLTVSANLNYIGNDAFYTRNYVNREYSGRLYPSLPMYMPLENIDIRGTNLVIGNRAFMNCNTRLVNLREGVVSIGDDAFCNIRSLEHINMPNSTLKTIGKGFLYACDKLQSLIIPASVTSIEGPFLWGCSGLRNVYFFGQPSALTQEVYYNDSSVPVTTGSYNFYGGNALRLGLAKDVAGTNYVGPGYNEYEQFDAVHDCTFWVNSPATYCNFVGRDYRPNDDTYYNTYGVAGWQDIGEVYEQILTNNTAQWRQLDAYWTKSTEFAEQQRELSGFAYTQYNNRYNSWSRDQEATNGTAYTIPYQRKLSANKWATICFPFAGDADYQQYLKDLYNNAGYDNVSEESVIIAKYVKAEQRQTYEDGLYHLTFQRVHFNELKSNYPYVIYSPIDVTIDMLHGKSMTNAHWTADISQTWEVWNEPGTDVTMIGNYINPMYLRSNVYFLQSYVKNGQPTMRFVKTAEWGTSWVPEYRCYFEVAKKSGSVITSAAMGYHIPDNLDEPTGIDDVVIEVEEPEQHVIEGIYTLNGVKLATTDVKELPRGIYIVNGKKVVIK